MKRKAKVMLITLLVCSLIGCSKKEASVFEATVLEVNNSTLLVEPVEAEKWDLIPMVMVNGELYLDTGYESTVND